MAGREPEGIHVDQSSSEMGISKLIGILPLGVTPIALHVLARIEVRRVSKRQRNRAAVKLGAE
jgi:hypothetical protein